MSCVYFHTHTCVYINKHTYTHTHNKILFLGLSFKDLFEDNKKTLNPLCKTKPSCAGPRRARLPFPGATTRRASPGLGRVEVRVEGCRVGV